MSTNFRPLTKIHISDLLDGRLAGVREHVEPGSTDDKHKCLTDGRNSLWVYVNDDGFASQFTRHGANAPRKILAAIAEAFDTDIVSEYQPQFWGFDTQEEWDAHDTAIYKKYEDHFYLDLVNFVTNKPNGITPGTVGEIQAKIAKQLVDAEPTLILPERREDLMKKVAEIYDRDHQVVVTLSEQEIALAVMMATHDSDLPQA